MPVPTDICWDYQSVTELLLFQQQCRLSLKFIRLFIFGALKFMDWIWKWLTEVSKLCNFKWNSTFTGKIWKVFVEPKVFFIQSVIVNSNTYVIPIRRIRKQKCGIGNFDINHRFSKSQLLKLRRDLKDTIIQQNQEIGFNIL